MRIGQRGLPRLLLALAAVSSAALAVVPASAATAPHVLRAQISRDTGVIAGEGWVVTDPRHPGTIVLTWLATSDAESVTGGSAQASPANITRGYCGLGISTNGGRTWTTRQLPFAQAVTPAGAVSGVQQGNRNSHICGDPVMGVGPDGTIYAAAAHIGSPQLEQGITSHDDGRTWSTPTEVFGPEQTAASATGNAGSAKTVAIGPGRAFMAVDPETGAVSVISQEDGGAEARWITVSTDRGKTWGTPHQLDPDLQSKSAGAQAAANGTIAVAYNVDPTSPTYLASPAPAVTCSALCTVFETTNDQGKTWSRHVIHGAVADGGIAGSTWVAADPSHRGRFAVLMPTGSGSRLEIWRTDDSGVHWRRVKLVTAGNGGSLFKAAIAYSPTGALGLVWRTAHSDSSYDVSAIVSRDGGTAWSRVVPLTSKSAPPNFGFSDDCACNVDMDRTSLATTWGDARTGIRQLWFARFDYTHLAMHR
jgi:hypothetical protein